MDLGPNGLPYSRCPPAENEWTEFSRMLAQLPGDTVATMHPGVVARQRHGVGGGMGLFACNGLAKGEVVWAERAQAGSEISAVPRSRAWIEALPQASKRAYCHFMYKTGEDEYQSLAEFNDMPIDQFPSVRTVDVSNFMNHSCTPSCLFVDGGDEYVGVMVAARELMPGDEITYDYCTSEDCELSPEWQCLCGTPECRGRVTPHDWRQAPLQAKYKGHFLPHIAAKIATATGAEEAAPLQVVDPRASWWMRQLERERARERASVCAPCARPPPKSPAEEGAEAGGSSSRADGRDDGEPARKEARPNPKAVAAPATPAAGEAPVAGEALAAGKAVPIDGERARRREALLSNRASGPALDTINRQAAMLIVHHGLKVHQNEQVGGYVRLGAPVSKGELVMLLPPNLLLWEDQVDDFNKCVRRPCSIHPSVPAAACVPSIPIASRFFNEALRHQPSPHCPLCLPLSFPPPVAFACLPACRLSPPGLCIASLHTPGACRSAAALRAPTAPTAPLAS